MNNKRIINRLVVNTNIISNVLLGGIVVSECPINDNRDIVKIGFLVTFSTISDMFLIKKYIKRRKNKKKV